MEYENDGTIGCGIATGGTAENKIKIGNGYERPTLHEMKITWRKRGLDIRGS